MPMRSCSGACGRTDARWVLYELSQQGGDPLAYWAGAAGPCRSHAGPTESGAAEREGRDSITDSDTSDDDSPFVGLI